MYILMKIVLIVISTYNIWSVITGKDFESMAIQSIGTYNNL